MHQVKTDCGFTCGTISCHHRPNAAYQYCVNCELAVVTCKNTCNADRFSQITKAQQTKVPSSALLSSHKYLYIAIISCDRLRL